MVWAAGGGGKGKRAGCGRKCRKVPAQGMRALSATVRWCRVILRFVLHCPLNLPPPPRGVNSYLARGARRWSRIWTAAGAGFPRVGRDAQRRARMRTTYRAPAVARRRCVSLHACAPPTRRAVGAIVFFLLRYNECEVGARKSFSLDKVRQRNKMSLSSETFPKESRNESTVTRVREWFGDKVSSRERMRCVPKGWESFAWETQHRL